MLGVPTIGTHSWKHIQKETVTLVGPMTHEESLQIRNNRLSIPVTVSGIQSHSKTSKCMIMYNDPRLGVQCMVRTLGECLAVTVHSKSRRPVALSWRRCNSCDDSASAYELPPATYNNLQVSESTDRAGTQNTRKGTPSHAHTLQGAAKVPKVVFNYTNIQMVQCKYHSRPAANLITVTGGI